MMSSTGAGVGVDVKAGVNVGVGGATVTVPVGVDIGPTGRDVGVGVAHEASRSSAVKIKASVRLFTGDARPFYRFHKPSLQYEVHDQERQDVQERAAQFDSFIQAVKDVDRSRWVKVLVSLHEFG